MSADTIVPGHANPQSLNRYSYVTNNPLRYTDPTGHMLDAGCSMGCSYTPPPPPTNYCTTHPGACGNNNNNNGSNNPHNDDNSDGGAGTLLTSDGPCVGTPGNAGSFYGGYCAGGGGLLQSGINSVGGDGDCIGNVCSFTGGSIPLSYSASLDILLFDNLMVATLHENYWIPELDLPLMENPTFGGSTLISQLSSGHQVETNLGSFISGNAAHPERLTHRDIQINYWGKSNFPTQLVIRLIFGAENRGASTIYYQLPYQTP